MPAACRRSSRRASTWPVCCATGPPTSARDRSCSRPGTEAGGRTLAVRPGAVPNLLSLVLVGLVPVLFVTPSRSGPEAPALARLRFLAAWLTDFLHRWLARSAPSPTGRGLVLHP